MKPAAVKSQLWNEFQAAEYLGVAVATLRHWRHKMKGPRYLKYLESQTVRYRQSDLDEFLDASIVDPKKLCPKVKP